MSAQNEIMLIAIIVSASCSIPGTFLVLRKMSMMTDSITHTIVLGIVLAFFVTKDLSSPFLIVGAAMMGVITVWLTEALNKTKLLSEDASIGIIFPLLFSIAIILLSKYAGKVHLCTDTVLLGELAFAPFDRMIINGVDMGPKSLFVAVFLLIINLLLMSLFFKELKLVTFDPVLAGVLGISPVIFHYGLMTIVSLTAVGSFQAVGAILVIAFMIGPPTIAYLLTDNLKHMIIISVGIGALSGIVGSNIAQITDTSIGGCMAVTVGFLLLAVFIFAPKNGLISRLKLMRTNKIEFAKISLLFHLYNHEGTHGYPYEAGIDTVGNHMNWSKKFTAKITDILIKEGKIQRRGVIHLTHKGRNTPIEKKFNM